MNGAYFVRPTDTDLDRWAAAGHDRWSAAALLPAFRRLERDLDLGTTSLHGGDGPVTVQRHGAPVHPLTAAFFAVCDADGHPEHADLNDGGDRGWGLVPRNVDHLGRVDTATAYLDPVRARSNLEIRGGWTVSDLAIERGRVVGVQRRGRDGRSELVHADEVVLCAGALGSPSLVERAGIGVPMADRPVALHPAVDLHFEPVARVELEGAPLVQGALHVVLDSGGVVEVLAMCRPYGRATGAAPQHRTVSLRVSLMQARTCAQRHEGSAGGWLELRSPRRWAPQDRADLRDAIRMASGLAAAAPLATLVDTWHGPSGPTLSVDDRLDEWIAERVVVSMHAAASAPMGPAGDPGAVVDQIGRVHATGGLRIADTSILPGLPSRGPACLAIAMAEHLAPTFD